MLHQEGVEHKRVKLEDMPAGLFCLYSAVYYVSLKMFHFRFLLLSLPLSASFSK